jgi:hypothetical protein
MVEPQKIKNGNLYDPSIPPLNIYPKESKSDYYRDRYLHTYVCHCIVHNIQVSLDDHQWIKKMRYMYIMKGILFWFFHTGSCYIAYTGFLLPQPQECLYYRYVLSYPASTMQFYLSTEKNAIMPFAGKWRKLETILSSKTGKSHKDKYCMFSLICGI